MNGMYAPTGGNIDGGTYPADIWGTYMKKAVGSYCGDFKRPTEPFTSQPFQGHYARQGGKEEDESGDDPSDAQVPEPGAETEPEDGADGNGDTNRGGDNGNDARQRQRQRRQRRRQRRGLRPEPVRDPAAGRARDRSAGGGTQAPPGDG